MTAWRYWCRNEGCGNEVIEQGDQCADCAGNSEAARMDGPLREMWDHPIPNAPSCPHCGDQVQNREGLCVWCTLLHRPVKIIENGDWL